MSSFYTDHLRASAPSHVAEFALRDGLAIARTAEASTTPAKKRRFATVAGVLLASKHLVHVAIFHEAETTPEFLQALETMLSMRFIHSKSLALVQP